MTSSLGKGPYNSTLVPAFLASSCQKKAGKAENKAEDKKYRVRFHDANHIMIMESKRLELQLYEWL